MAHYRLDWHDPFPDACRHGAVSVGNFDGAHRGHAVLIAATVRQARAIRGPAVAMTFDPHPLALLRPDQPPERLTTPADRAACLLALGVDVVVTLAATDSLLELGATEFFTAVLRDRLDARAVVEGSNFGFGRQREGDVSLLERLCRPAGIPLSVIAPVVIDGIEVSSSRIRAELRRGDVAAAARMLGRPYRLRGRVIEGQRRGRTIGYPTANLGDVTTQVPAAGVYAVVAHTADGAAHAGAANLGGNPTFAEAAVKIEVHLLDYQGDLYGQELAIDLVARLRETRPFAGVAELTAQMARDVEQARRLAGAAIGM